jgi:hypothetical protein
LDDATEDEMADRLVAAAERGFPGNRTLQIQQIAAHLARAPLAFTGVALKALEKLTRASSE